MIETLSRSSLNTAVVLLALVTACSAESSGVATSLPATGLATTTAPATTVVEATSTTPPSTTTTTTLDLGEELVFNGAFEAGQDVPTGWEFVVDGEGQRVEHLVEGEDDYVSLFGPVVEGSPWPEAHQDREFPVEPHTRYALTAEARTATQGRLFLALAFRDENGRDILLRDPGSPTAPVADWGEIGGLLESPSGAATAHVVIQLALRPDLTEAESFSVDVRRVSVRQVLP